MKAAIRFVMAFAGLFFSREVLADDGGISVYWRSNYNPEGKAFARATPAKPVYYQPMFFGYREEGHPVSFYSKSPPMTANQTAQAEHLLVKELAAQGYRIATKLSPPSLIITFAWGDRAQESSWHKLPDRQEYFLKISALDLKASQQHKRVQLWSLEVLTPRWGHYIDEVLPTMIASGTPAFGRPPAPINHVGFAGVEAQASQYYYSYSKITAQLVSGSDLN